MEQNQTLNPKDAIRAIRILFIALIAGVVMFLAIIIGLSKLKAIPVKDTGMDNIFLIAASVIAVVCIISGMTVYKKRITEIANSTNGLDQKLEQYRAALILYLALGEGAALFSVICLFITANYWFVGITVVMLTMMFLKNPTKSRLTSDLQLSSQEEQEL